MLAIAPPAPTPDADLLRLGAQLLDAILVETAAWAVVGNLQPDVDDDWPEHVEAQAQMAVVGEIAERIGAIQAPSLAGVLVKVRAVVWCRCGDAFDPVNLEPGLGNGPPSTHAQILVSMLTDLEAMGRAGA